MDSIMLKIDNVSKQYKLGQIGGTTLRDELQRLSAKVHGKEDPTKRIGTKDYNKGETFMALSGVSFEVKKGERVGIIGHNGAGKSTLLKLISRVTAPTGGTISMNGRVASMLEVGTGFHGELTGRENIYMNGAILGMTKKEIDAKMEDIIEFSECRQFIDTPVKRYSSGMYVKLAFSVAAHLDSEIMIMDEVLAVGDMAFQKKCLDKMTDVSRTDGRTILYVSHNMNTIRQLCDRVVVLDRGKVIFDGGVEDGIGVYMNEKDSGGIIINYADYIRDKWFGKDRIRLQNVVALNSVGNLVFERLDGIQLELVFFSKECADNVGFRLELRDTGNSPIAASNTFHVVLKEGLNFVKIKYQTEALSPGRYKSVFTTFSSHDYGGNCVEDWVPGISFEIVDSKGKYGSMEWPRAALGYIILPEGELERDITKDC